MDIANIEKVGELYRRVGDLRAAAQRWETVHQGFLTHGYHVAQEDFDAFREASKRFIAAELEKLHAEIAAL